MLKVIFPYEALPDADYLVSAGTIVSKMVGNPNYPDQQTEAQEAKDLVGKFFDYVEEAKGGSKAIAIKRDDTRTLLTTMLRTMGNHVTAVANGRKGYLEGSGYPFSAPAKPTPPMVTPAPPKAFAGVNQGDLGVRSKKQKGCKAVIYMITDTPDVASSWKSETSTKSKHVFTGLESFKEYFVKYKLVGVRNQVVESIKVSAGAK